MKKANVQQAALCEINRVLFHAETCEVSEILPAMKMIAQQNGLNLTRWREFRITKAIFIKSVLYN